MASAANPSGVRLDWIDSARGFSILWVAWFHFFVTWADGRLPWPFDPAYFSKYAERCGASGPVEWTACGAEALFVAFSQLGSQAVAVFLLLSGLGLTYSLGENQTPARGWRGWYRQRLLRLLPMYWVAHAVWLVSPLVARSDAVDWRFVASLLGDRIWPPELFYYANPAWWFFGLLLQLYLVFPLLARLLHRLGPVRFLGAAIGVTIASRWLLLDVVQANGIFVQGAFFGSRLWEFAAGMSLGLLLRRGRASGWLLGPAGLVAGALLYAAGFLSYRPGWTFTCTDGLIGMGLFALVANACRVLVAIVPLRRPLLWLGAYSYGFYLLHQPYVIYAGERMRELPLEAFVGVGTPLLAAIACGSGMLEAVVSRCVGRIVEGAPREAARTSPKSQG